MQGGGFDPATCCVDRVAAEIRQTSSVGCTPACLQGRCRRLQGAVPRHIALQELDHDDWVLKCTQIEFAVQFGLYLEACVIDAGLSAPLNSVGTVACMI